MVVNLDPVRMENVANTVVHSETKEIITKYIKLITDLLLQEDGMKVICTEVNGMARRLLIYIQKI